VIYHAEARDLVGRNLAALVNTPKGQAGRPGSCVMRDRRHMFADIDDPL
jgi:hypothetical protein